MKNAPNQTSVRKSLHKWFSENKRDLPWRLERSPYKTWLSEIILQQTRVAQGLPYFEKFMEAFPDVQALAAASEQEVLKLWQGLGYYSRARNLHHAAKTVVDRCEGAFPGNFEELLALKGVGNYTASAILSINFNLPYAVLDGNVYRVLSRLYNNPLPVNGKGADKIYQKLADELLDKKAPGNFNEAMMELGATVCIPKNPLCTVCPLQKECMALRMGTVDELPVKLAKTAVTNREINYLFIHNSGKLYLKKREGADIWQGLYDFPEMENIRNLEEPKVPYGSVKATKAVKTMFHKLSHRNLSINFFEIALSGKPKEIDLQGVDLESAVFVPFESLREYPLPKPIEIFLEDYLRNANL